MRILCFGLVFAAVVAGLVACTPLAAQQGAKPEGTLRVMTYNIEWFSEDANPKRVANVKSVVTSIAPDIIGMQEIQSRKALDQVFDAKNWQIGTPDDPKQNQELAVAVRRPYVLVSSELIFATPSLDMAFPENRDVLRAVVQTPEGKQVVVYVVHMKSRRGGRATTDARRQMACGLLAAYIHGRDDETNAIVLGDFNDAPDDASVNVLESGELTAGGGDAKSNVMQNLTEPLAAKDYVTYGVHDFYTPGKGVEPIAKGAFADNARLRGKDYNYPADVKVKQTFMDQILATPALAKSVGRVEVYAGEDAVRGTRGSTQMQDGVVTYSEKGELASDHLPVFADVRPN